MKDDATLAKTPLFPNECPNLQAKIVVVGFDFFLKKDIIVTISMLWYKYGQVE